MKSGPKVYPVLLALAYLEVVIWITVLCTPASLAHNPEDTAFLGRETENLKHSLAAYHCIEDPFDAVLKTVDLEALRTSQDDVLLFERAKDSGSRPVRSLRDDDSFLSFVLSFTGVPAPFAGVKAIF